MDRYPSFAALRLAEREGTDFRVRRRTVAGAATLLFAPHGGRIEPGTSELASAIAGRIHSFYAFEGLRARDNGRLHLTSTRFDEPRGLALALAATRVVTLHGARAPAAVVYLGGADHALRERLGGALAAARFVVDTHRDPRLQGTHPDNVCNRGRSRAGLQLELGRGLRDQVMSPTRAGREAFRRFVATVRAALG